MTRLSRGALTGLRIALVVGLTVVAARAAADSAVDRQSAAFLFAPAAAALAALLAALEQSPGLRRFAGIGWLLGFDLAAIALAVLTLGEATRPDLLAFLLLALVVATARDVVSGTLSGLLAANGYAYLAHRYQLPPAWPELLGRAVVYVSTGLFLGLLSSETDAERAEARAKTEQLQRELEDLATHLKNVLASVASGVISTGVDGKVTTYNRAAEKILGVPAHRALGRPLGDNEALGPLARLALATTVPELREGQASGAASQLLRTDLRADVEFPRPDGTRIKLGYVTTPLEDLAGRRLGVIFVFQDVTLIRDYEERLLRQEKLAALGRLVSGIAHEFGNILGGARGHVEFAQRDGSLEEAKAALDVLRTTLDRSLSTIEHLLRFARGTPIHRVPGVLVPEVVERALHLTQRELEAAAIVVERRFSPAPPIEGDAAQLEQVFLNILINARQALEGRPKKVVRIEIATAAEGGVVVTVDDSGPGVAEAIRDKIFEPFFTTKGALGGSPVPGTGLGLSVALGIVEGHGGSLSVEASSALGGARFVVRLPSTSGDASAKAV